MDGLRRQPAAALLLALASAAAMALRIAERSELWIDRTLILIAISALGGLIAGLTYRLPLLWTPLRRTRPRRRILPALSFAALYPAAVTVLLVVHSQVIEGRFEPRPGVSIYHQVMGVIEALAFLMASTTTYLLPWPLPGLMLLAAFLATPAAAEVERPGGAV